jgi:hypothetical protein
LLGLAGAAVAACGLLAWLAVAAAPASMLPADTAELQVRQNTMARYQATYRAARPLTEWRVATIERLTAAGWARGRRPDSPSFDRSLWFVRRRTVGGFSLLEQVSIRADDGPSPEVLLTYQRTFTLPAFLRWLNP